MEGRVRSRINIFSIIGSGLSKHGSQTLQETNRKKYGEFLEVSNPADWLTKQFVDEYQVTGYPAFLYPISGCPDTNYPRGLSNPADWLTW